MKYVVIAVLMFVFVWVVVAGERERVEEVLVRSKPRSGSAPKRLLSRSVWMRFESRSAAAPGLLRLTWSKVVMRVVWRTRSDGRSVKAHGQLLNGYE